MLAGVSLGRLRSRGWGGCGSPSQASQCFHCCSPAASGSSRHHRGGTFGSSPPSRAHLAGLPLGPLPEMTLAQPGPRSDLPLTSPTPEPESSLQLDPNRDHAWGVLEEEDSSSPSHAWRPQHPSFPASQSHHVAATHPVCPVPKATERGHFWLWGLGHFT